MTVFFLAIAGINAAKYFLLSFNLAAGLYTPQTDSIGVVFLSGVEVSKYILVWLVPICAATSLDGTYRLTARYPGARKWLIVMIVLAYTWLAWLFFSWGVPFLRPNHYSVAGLCTLAATLPFFMAKADIRRVARLAK